MLVPTKEFVALHQRKIKKNIVMCMCVYCFFLPSCWVKFKSNITGTLFLKLGYKVSSDSSG